MEQHIHYLNQALDLAKKRQGFCAPNPAVGVVIVKDNKIIATGYHFEPGQPHAEVVALQKVTDDLTDAILYSTLEPCCHHGRTPPCTDLIIKKGIKKVIYGMSDPNPKINGLGEAELQKAGIVGEQIVVPKINEFYQSYRYWTEHQKPWVTAKIAISLDGKITGLSGSPIAITGEALKSFTYYWRKKSDAILTTAQTILKDNPQLNVRLEKEPIAKPLYILDTHLAFPKNAQVLQTAKALTLFHKEGVNPHRREQLQELGVRCISIPEDDRGLDLSAVLAEIAADGVHDLWVESGGKCFSSFLTQNLLQRALIYIAPKFIGDSAISAFAKLEVANFQAKQINWYSFDSDVVCELNF